MDQKPKRPRSRWFARYRGLPPTVLALSVVSFLNDTSSEIVYPLLPAFLFVTLGATPLVIGFIEGIAESVASILKLFSGYLSDRFGRRKLPVFLGYSLAAVARPMLAFVTTWQHVLIVRMSDRMGKGIRGAPRDAMLAAEVGEDRRGLAFGFNRAADHLGAVVGPVIGFLLLTYMAVDPENPTAMEYQRVFLYASVPVALGLVVIVFFVRESPRTPDVFERMPIRFSLGEFDGNFKRFLLIIAVFTLSNSTDAFLLLRAEQAGIAPAMLPLLWMVLHFSKVVSSLVGGDLSDRLGRKALMISGWIVYALVYLGFAFVETPWQAWALFAAYGVYFGLTQSAEKALVADLIVEEKRGTAFGFYNLAIGITVLPASVIFGFLWYQFGAPLAFATSACVSLVAAALLLSVRPKPIQA